jgi:hypothetical protein
MLVVLNLFNLPAALGRAASSSAADAYRHAVQRRAAAPENATTRQQRRECEGNQYAGHRVHAPVTHKSQILKNHNPASIKHYRNKFASVT